MIEICQQCPHLKSEHYPHPICPSFQPCGAIVRGDTYEQVCSCPDYADRSDSVVQCSTCDNREELSGEITAQTLIDDNWLLEPVVYCPRCGEDDDES